jgi:hypothetical protein
LARHRLPQPAVTGTLWQKPPLAEALEIPYDQYDEWYLLDECPPFGWEPEVFVNYAGFTLVPTEEIKNTHPEWDECGLDWLALTQERF